MSMVVMHNIPALSAYNTVNRTSSSLQKSIQKLSTGLRINSAADDAAGLAISEKMRAQIRGLDRAVSNSQDGISMIQTAEGALNETHSILQRMRELSVQSANDTLTQQDRGYIQLEIDQLREEVTRIGNTTQFNKKKLLDGSAAVLWSSDNLNTKAIINGGLRQIDQFGQKKAIEGNYNIKVKAEAGQGEVQKSDVFKVKHKDVFNINSKDAVIQNIKVSNLQAQKADGTNAVYDIKGAAAGDIGGKRLATTGTEAHWVDGTIAGNITAPDTKGGSAELVVTLKSKTGGTATTKGTATFTVKGRITKTDGSVIDVAEQDVTLTAANNGDNWDGDLTAGALGDKLTGLSLAGTTFTDAIMQAMKVGDSAIFQIGKNDAAQAGDVQLSVTDPSATGPHLYNLKTELIRGKDVTLQHYYFEDGKLQTGSVTLSLAEKNPGGADLAAADLTGKTLAQFEMMKIGDTAKGNVKLRDLDKFWDAQGRFMLTDPQTIKITQGDGKTASFTLYANDTLNDVAKKLRDAIGNSEANGGLGQAQYLKESSAAVQLATFVDNVGDTDLNTSQTVKGTFVIRTIIPGSTGKLSFAGDEDLIKAFSLNVIQEAKESNYTVDITDAHTGETIISGAKTTGNKLIGALHPNVDVEFDAMAGVTATWSDVGKKFTYLTKDYSTILHLADNTTVFQIGANEGEDMGVNIGDMRAHALGLNAVLVTDRESAARSITIIDNAIDKVSTQRAKLGAYQNRLEHTINNLNTAAENLTSAESRIRDTDMAKEMMNFTKLQIMLQAGTSMLAQANQLPQSVMTLIR